MPGYKRRAPRLSQACKVCGVLIRSTTKSGLCHDCYRDQEHGKQRKYRLRGHSTTRGICMVCKRNRLVPVGKHPKWFRCDTCNRYLQQEGFLAGESFVGAANIRVPHYGMWRQ